MPDGSHILIPFAVISAAFTVVGFAIITYLPVRWLDEISQRLGIRFRTNSAVVDLDLHRTRKRIARSGRTLLLCKCDLDHRYGSGFLPVLGYCDGDAILEGLVCIKCGAEIAVTQSSLANRIDS
jgi:hypothetical protein